MSLLVDFANSLGRQVKAFNSGISVPADRLTPHLTPNVDNIITLESSYGELGGVPPRLAKANNLVADVLELEANELLLTIPGASAKRLFRDGGTLRLESDETTVPIALDDAVSGFITDFLHARAQLRLDHE